MKQFNNVRLIFFGSSKYVISIIQALKSAKSRFNLELVVTSERNSTDAIPSYCLTNKINFISVQQFNNETIQAIKDADASFAVLADFGLIIPKKILDIFPKGIINIHPSLLPKYRGSTPVQTAILNGELKTGVSLILLDSKVDHGPILVQKEEKIKKEDTANSLYKRLFEIGTSLLYQNIEKYIKEELMTSDQHHSKATYTNLLSKNDGFIDFDNPPSPVKIGRMIRAYYPWPGVFFRYKFDNKEKIVKLLPQHKIQIEGKNIISYKDFINGYPKGEEILKKLKLID